MCKLLNNVRGRDELEIVLNKVGKENEERFERLARIDLALKYQEMKVIEDKIASHLMNWDIRRKYKKSQI